MSDFENFLEDLEAELKCRNGLPQEFTEEAAEDLLYDLAIDHNAHYCHGISKAVVVFDNDDCVIKIPFNGYTDDCWNGETQHYEETFIPFCGAMGTEWNYCQTEANIYSDAQAYHVAEYFAETAYLKAICGCPIYVQPKVVSYDELVGYDCYDGRNSIEERNNTIQHCYDSGHMSCSINSDWLTDFLHYWGQEALDNLLTFIENECIGDFHDQNIGYLGDKPLILDYSDFSDC